MIDVTQSPVKDILIAVCSAIAAYSTKLIRDYRTRKQSKKAQEAIVASGQIVSLLQECASAAGADSALLLYTTNGGGVPHPGKPLYVTILYELLPGKSFKSIRENFQHALCDGVYLKLISNVIQEGHWTGGPDDMEDGFLKELYLREKVGYAHIQGILSTKTQFFYLSLRWLKTSSHPKTESAVAATTRTYGERISNILLEFKDK
jgi:hypothetical protein